MLFFSDSGEEKSDAQCVDDQSQTQSEAQQALNVFWPKVLEEIRSIRNVYFVKKGVLLLLLLENICLDGFKTTSITIGKNQKDYEIG